MRRRAAMAALVALAFVAATRAQDALPRLELNEIEIGEVSRRVALDIRNPLAVFAFVFGRLPERVNVLPTENYYYFRFVLNGAVYTGNIRLAAHDRDQGKVHFAYSELPTDRRPDPDVQHVALDASRGVTVEKLSLLAYRVAHAGKSVVFALNDLSQTKPPAGLLDADERFLGPIFDESAIRFFLVFNTRLKVFHYLLDDSFGVADEFVAAKATDRIVIGKRSAFAFYRNDRERRILIGVDRRNSELNSYFDGPFDQLPDNFIEGDALRDAIMAANPGVRGQIDRFGNFLNEDNARYLIHPDLRYRREAELTVLHRCAVRVAPAQRPRCFVIEDRDAMRGNPLPMALKRR
jgi:hypothetical protein